MRENRLNDLDSKSYMKFLKSWCLVKETSLEDFILFFTKEFNGKNIANNVAVWGFSKTQQGKLAQTNRNVFDITKKKSPNEFSYALINLQEYTFSDREKTNTFLSETLEPILLKIKDGLKTRGYITVLTQNKTSKNQFFPAAWIMGQWIARFFEMKDEKLIFLEEKPSDLNYISLEGSDVIYALNFRNTIDNPQEKVDNNFKKTSVKTNLLPKWFILKPPQRKEKVKLHPAKFPEVLVKYLIESYSQPGENIFDPMSGTGSTQVAALQSSRNAYGCEITDHFYEIALDRLNSIDTNGRHYALINDDAYNYDKHHELGLIFDYIVTSPPYWNMLNMKGAETQKKRQQKGLRINYSELDTDLGNCADYNEFLSKLIKIYIKILIRLKAGGYFTIIVKNIKKKGTIYTFAWDLVEHLGKNYEFVNEQFWLQDDIKIAPYGWGNAWVSNTFHHYILTFRKAE